MRSSGKTTRLTPWDPAEHLKTERDVVGYLNAAFEGGDSALIAAALGDVARAKGMGTVARAADLGRESLYKSLSVDGNPRLETILRVLHAIGLELRATPKRTTDAKPRRARV